MSRVLRVSKEDAIELKCPDLLDGSRCLATDVPKPAWITRMRYGYGSLYPAAVHPIRKTRSSRSGNPAVDHCLL